MNATGNKALKIAEFIYPAIPGQKVDLLATRPLLRYPGGKTRAIEKICAYFPAGLTEVCSPFLGGGSIELFLAGKGIKVFGYDIFKPLVEFWQSLLKSPAELANMVESYYPLSKDRFYQLQSTQMQFSTKLERAAVYYVLNRSSFSGSTLSGGMSPGHPRFTVSSIDRLRNFYNPNLTVSQKHFEETFALHKDTFMYLDPPYLIDSVLYGKKGDAHKDFDHEALARLLSGRKNWIMSYNDCETIRKFYKDHLIITPVWKYGMSNDKSSREVLIFSRNLTSKWANKPNREKLSNMR